MQNKDLLPVEGWRKTPPHAMQDAYVGFRLPNDLLEQVDAVGQREERSRAYVIRALIAVGLRQYEKDGKLPRPKRAESAVKDTK